VLALISYVGIDTGGITAVIASLGVGIGLAVNGTLSNLAGGLLIILTRPFRIDDFISAQGYDGTVEDIRIISTKLVTPDNKVVYIPNGALAGGNILNYSEKEKRRLDLEFTLPNSADLRLAISVTERAVAGLPYFLDEPKSSVRIKRFGEEGTTLFLRAWVKSEDYWSAFYDTTEAVWSGFRGAGVPTPERRIGVRLLEMEYDKNRNKSQN
jgi:small conductance mechanosensitive channel